LGEINSRLFTFSNTQKLLIKFQSFITDFATHCLNFNDMQICVTPIGSFKYKFEKLFLILMIVRENSHFM
jgi:hypothetical protein